MEAVIIFAIIFSLLTFILPYFLRKSTTPNNAAGIVMTMGVLGTFIGILWGLIEFKAGGTDQMKYSVPVLLNGLRFAFITSIVGMISGLFIKLFPNKGLYWFETDKQSEGASIDDIVINLKEIASTIKHSSEKENTQLKNIEKALTGEGDTTLLTQMQKMRTTFNDKQDDLIKEFKGFAEKMTENNSKALIDALTEVMKDFNAKINEQFGDNFKQLNDAVKNMLTWQENYKEHIEKLESQFKYTVDSIEKSQVVAESVINKLDVFKSSAKQLEKILIANDIQIKGLEEFLKGFTNIANDSKNVIPIIEENINKLIDDFKGVKEQFSEQNKNLISLQESLNKEMTETASKFRDQWTTHFKEQSKNVISLQESLNKDLTDTAAKLKTQMGETASKFSDQWNTHFKEQSSNITSLQEALNSNIGVVNSTFKEQWNSHFNEQSKNVVSLQESLNKNLNDTVSKLGNQWSSLTENNLERIDKQILVLDKALEDELKKSLTTFAGQLSSLSQKFVEDYSPLTDQLVKVIQIAKDLKT